MVDRFPFMPGLEEVVKGTPATRLVYLDDAYATSYRCEVIRVIKDGGNSYVLLDATIFHPKAGGQPSDRGSITEGEKKVEVKRAMGVWDETGFHVIHYGKGIVGQGLATLSIDWQPRYLYMRRHTAAHLLDHCLAEVTGRKTVTLGSWLGDESYVDYAGSPPSPEEIKKVEELERRYVNERLPVTFKVIPAEEAASLEAPNEERLPKYARELRLVRIGEFEWIPCGGTHVRTSGEIGDFRLLRVTPVQGGYRVYFDVGRDGSSV